MCSHDPSASSTSCSLRSRYFHSILTSCEEFTVLVHLRAALRFSTTSVVSTSLFAFVSTSQPVRLPASSSTTTKSGL